jgi:probable rRNA maturation factor
VKALPICFRETLMVIFETEVEGVSAAEIQRFARRAQKLAKISGEVGVLISGNSRLRELNRRFRRKDKPTDVLSFPCPAGGDIAISADIARENAHRYGHGTAEELKVLVLHGMLHLAGYDHESDNGRMARTESRLRVQLRLPASLIDRTHSPSSRTRARAPVSVAARSKHGKPQSRANRTATHRSAR